VPEPSAGRPHGDVETEPFAPPETDATIRRPVATVDERSATPDRAAGPRRAPKGRLVFILAILFALVGGSLLVCGVTGLMLGWSLRPSDQQVEAAAKKEPPEP